MLGYEVWNRINALGRIIHGDERGRCSTGSILTEMSQSALARALEPLPVSLRTLDALHLATMDFLRRNDGSIELASYDNRLIAAAQALGIPARAAVDAGRGGRPR